MVFRWANVSVNATDDVGVAGVTFQVNGRTVPAGRVQVTGSTFGFRYVPSRQGARDTLSATATDAAGNATTTQVTILGFR
ncbi:MAG: hypothetical protein DYH08_05330 [Actinobacteria bacterium ATB1]|nr:hypothetical protein [Actinobacteria bacterium ATB1]